jgi:hypothetical protein
MENRKIRILLQALPLILPLNIYLIGDALGTGLQWALVRYQQTYLGTGIIPVTRDIGYVLSGLMAGYSGLSLIIWSLGTLLLIVAFLLVISTACHEHSCRYTRYSPFLTVLAGILFLMSCMLQYGISLYGPAGFSIPFGVPVLMVIGYWTYRLDEGEVPVIGTETHQDGD